MKHIDFEVISLFPKAFDSLNSMGVISRAIKKNLISINIFDLRDYGEGSYRQVDDEPYGGGAGMVLKPEPIYKAYESIKKSSLSKTLLMTPQGNVLKQKDFVRWSKLEQLIIICGQYEGFDERVRVLADEEISNGDFILTGGEIPAMSIINGLARLIPGTLGDPDSLINESHNSSFLEYPQYTRPFLFREMQVPDILVSGNHKAIDSWRKDQMIKRTMQRRKDLISKEDFKNDSENTIKNEDLNSNIRFIPNREFDLYPDW